MPLRGTPGVDHVSPRLLGGVSRCDRRVAPARPGKSPVRNQSKTPGYRKIRKRVRVFLLGPLMFLVNSASEGGTTKHTKDTKKEGKARRMIDRGRTSTWVRTCGLMDLCRGFHRFRMYGKEPLPFSLSCGSSVSWFIP